MNRWPTVELSEVCELKYGKSLPASKRVDGEFAVFGSNGVVGSHTDSITDGPTIIVGRKGSFGEVNYSDRACWPIDTTYYIDSSATDADLRWLFHRLGSLGLTQLNRAAAVPGLNREDAYRKAILLPPIDEQRRIAAILDHADALRAKRREALARLDELTQSIFIDMFGDPIVNPRGYPIKPLQELIDPARPITYGILKPGEDVGEAGVKYVRVVDMKNGEILADTVRSTSREIAETYRRSRLIPGDLLMSIRGHVGRVAIVPDSLEGANITQDTARLAVVGASTAYVRECISTAGFRRWMDRHTKGVAVRGINLGDVKEMPIPVPEPEQQEEFARVVATVVLHRSTVRESLSAMEAEFASLQSRAFRGEL
ncbi:restriction endonuclease subunit S [Nocardia farcinica]|uniref:restriction endonuclease subunit S n=1 Tax=Nocardia farcinica TaxID=37329 RepID=UPI000BF56126|nr:restriction endonuclease subunit S [Nocardia farcinica]MBF6419627.1 restriction endonuclease subunit S [Nocardia farcinica]MBF6431104.1 restriction endonuclease subunit S [Nocardia farcinica]MBF6501618.1 restriction endonuclease subunit S [Nocardia farcinica]PFW98257.1 hypothetical protein CJ469_06391 [Nocardia farcinica]PFW98823.1 hypothetical protein CJ468_06427 [Nocardia farcinica]